MFSLIFGGKLGEFIAPRLTSNKELWSMIKAGLLEKALNELRNPKNQIDVNLLDPSSGMTLLHLCCAQGAMELVVEFLSLGADISAFSADGNNCLHFAAINDRKGIVEILLRSGADPSIPNSSGTLPVELSKSPAVQELFLRDRSAIFSPIVQTRMLLSDYIEQMNINPTSSEISHSAKSEMSRTEAAVSSSNSMIFNMQDTLGAVLEQATPPSPTPEISTDITSFSAAPAASSPVRLTRDFSTLDSPASTPQRTNGRSESRGDYTLVGVASVKKPQNSNDGGAINPFRNVEDYDSYDSTGETHPKRHSSTISINGGCTSTSSYDQCSSPAPASRTAIIPKLNLGDISVISASALSPPPTAAECAQQALAQSGSVSVSGGMHSARGGQSATSAAGGSRSNSINFYQPVPVPVPPVIGAMTTPRTERSDGNRGIGVGLSSVSQDGTPSGGVGSSVAISMGGADEFEQAMTDEAELRQAVLDAAAQTALAMQSNRDDFESRRLMVRNCQKLNEAHLRKLLTFNPHLAMSRTTEMGNLAMDGQTPLHVAASFGNTDALKVMVEKGEGVSLWVRDLQGRTPLHVAAQKGHISTCEYLREQMRVEKHRDPVGENAPTDLVGTTPMGWATIGAKGKPKQNDMLKALFSPGDKTVLPKTPVSVRAGKSPWKVPCTAGYDNAVRENVVFAFSEANGWTPYMEDRILVSCPVTGRPAWSLFGVCDGHGGAFCSEYLANNLPAMLAKEAAMLARYMGTTHSVASDSDVSAQQMGEMLRRVCVDADSQLAEHPRMFVEHAGAGSRVKYTCMDSSGSTAVLALVTSQFVVVGNVGDSRAVLAVRPASMSTSTGILSSPFPNTASPRARGTSAGAFEEVKAPPSSSAGVGGGGDDSVKNVEGEGDSSPLSGRNSFQLLEAVALSRDHKVTIEEEKERIIAAGATVEQVGESAEGREPVFQLSTPACDVKLRMTRSFGDFYLKQNKDLSYEQQAVIAVPEIKVHTRSARDAFVVLACDGIWDVMTNQDVVDFMGRSLGYTAYGGPVGGVTTQSAASACDALLQECLERGTVDNISVVLVVLGAPPVISQVGTGANAGQSSARATPISGTNLADVIASAGPASTPLSARAAAGSRSALNHGARNNTHAQSHHHQSSDSEVDIPIFSNLSQTQKNKNSRGSAQGGSLNEIFDAVADVDEISGGYAASPLNTAAGSSRPVKKHLSFTDS